MAQDQNQQKGQQQQQQQQQQSASRMPLPDSPFYSKDNIPSDCKEVMALWLFKKDWVCLGHPNWESASWYAPNKPAFPTAELVPRMGLVWTNTGEPDPRTGKLIHELREQQLKQQDGVSTTGALTVDIKQLRVTFPAAPVSYKQAVQMQLANEDKAKKDALEAQRKKDEEAKRKTALVA